MRTFTLAIIALIFIICSGCERAKSTRYNKLQDTIEALRISADFRPLDSIAAYNFLNGYYLPMLDSILLKRRLFIYPLNTKNWKNIFDTNAKHLKMEYDNDTAALNANPTLLPPFYFSFDEHHTWNKHRLLNVQFVTDPNTLNLFKNYHHPLSPAQVKAWRKKFGNGYFCISYPFYNAHKNRLYMQRQLIINGNFYATDTGQPTGTELWFKKTAQGWQKIN